MDEGKCQEAFIKINNAHDVLSDPELRKIYNRGGEKALEEHGKNGGQNAEAMFRQYFGREPDGNVKIVRDQLTKNI